MQALLAFGLIFFVLLSCSRDDSESEMLNIFGEDNRLPVYSKTFPWSAIGRLDTPIGTCTASLVGKRLILTASHCVYADGKEIKGQYRFHPNMIEGISESSLKAQPAFAGTKNYMESPGSDWAILTIELPLGDDYGWLEFYPTSMSSYPTHFMAVGYSRDFHEAKTAGVHVGCTVTGEDERSLLLHDCDSTVGASGGPLLHKETPDSTAKIAGIMVNELHPNIRYSVKVTRYDDKYANLFIPTAGPIKLINRVK